jgi:hypothetical protein
MQSSEIQIDTINKSRREITFDGARLSLILIAMIIPFYLAGDRLFHMIWENRDPLVQLDFSWWVRLISILLAVILHEAIHGALFALFAERGFRSVTFGISMSLGAIYCHCLDPLRVKHYRWAGIAPLLLLGILPYSAGLITGVTWFKTFGLLLTIGGFGDLLIFFKLLKFDRNLIIRDHPDKLGFIIEGT